MQLKNGNCCNYDDDVMIAKGKMTASDLYEMDFKPILNKVCVVRRSSPSLETWHKRLGHINLESVMKAIDWRGKVDQDFVCEGCILGKAHKLPFKKKEREREAEVGALVHADLAGPMSVRSPGGSKYFLLLKDDYSGMMFVYFVADKGSVHLQFQQFLLDWKHVTGKSIQRLRTDNGTEFVNFKMEKLFRNAFLRHETSLPHTPEQNGFIERAIRTVTEAARSMIHGADVQMFLWAEAVKTAVHILNRCPPSKGDISPFELVTGNRPSLEHIRIFGSKAFAHVRDETRSKWEKKAKEMILVGFNLETNSYRLWDASQRRIVNTRNVTVIEEERKKHSEIEFPNGEKEEERTKENIGSDDFGTESPQRKKMIRGYEVVIDDDNGQEMIERKDEKEVKRVIKSTQVDFPEEGSSQECIPDRRYRTTGPQELVPDHREMTPTPQEWIPDHHYRTPVAQERIPETGSERMATRNQPRKLYKEVCQEGAYARETIQSLRSADIQNQR